MAFLQLQGNATDDTDRRGLSYEAEFFSEGSTSNLFRLHEITQGPPMNLDRYVFLNRKLLYGMMPVHMAFVNMGEIVHSFAQPNF